MKKLVILLLVCCLSLSLAGCGKEMTLKLAYGDRTGTYSGDLNEQGLPHGQGKFTSTNAEGEKWTYVGEFKNGHFDGEGKTTWKSGTVEGQTGAEPTCSGSEERMVTFRTAPVLLAKNTSPTAAPQKGQEMGVIPV